MQVVHLPGAHRFAPEKMQKVGLFQTERLTYDLYCLEPGQEQRVHAHSDADKVYAVLEGTGRFSIAGEERDLGPGYAVIAPAGQPHGVRNESAEQLVLLVTMSPPPAR